MRYVEIGLGAGDTFIAAAQHLNSLGADFYSHGVDLPGYPILEVQRRFEFASRFHIHAVGAEEFLKTFGAEIHFAFIDGCHGAKCTTADFLGVERLAAQGCVVVFHDTDPESQGVHMQPHCRTGIDCRRAVKELGLLDGTRPGWTVLGETTGDKLRGGHGCLFVQKYAE